MVPRPYLVLRADDVMPFQLAGAEQYLSQELLSSENTRLHDGFLNRGTLRAKQALGGGAHPNHDEIYYVLSGYGAIRLGGDPSTGRGADTYRVEQGSVVYIPANTFHALRNDADYDLVFLTIWPQVTHPGDNDMHDERMKAWGTAFRLKDGSERRETGQGGFVIDRSRGWDPLVSTGHAADVYRTQ